MGQVAFKRIPHIHHRKNTRCQGNLPPFQPARITAPVPFFVMRVRDIRRRPKILDREHEIMGKRHVGADELPFLVCQGRGLEKDFIGNSQFPNIVQQCAAINVRQFRFRHAHAPRQFHHQPRHIVAVTLRLGIADLKQARPTLDGIVVSNCQVRIGALQLLEQVRVVNRNRRLARQGFHKISPFQVRIEAFAEIQFQYALHLPARDQRHGIDAYKALPRDPLRMREAQAGRAQVGDADHGPLQGRAPGRVLPDHQIDAAGPRPTETAPGGVLQKVKVGIDQKNIRGIHMQMGGHLLEKHL